MFCRKRYCQHCSSSIISTNDITHGKRLKRYDDGKLYKLTSLFPQVMIQDMWIYIYIYIYSTT